MHGFLGKVLARLRRESRPAPPGPDAGAYAIQTVAMPGGESFQIVINADTDDPIGRHYLAGGTGNDYMYNTLRTFLRPFSRVLDLGGHIGTFALAAAATGHRVVVVDACPKHVDLLRRSAAANRFTHMRVVHAAVSDRPGVLRFHSRGLFGMVDYPGLGQPTEEVRAVAVDDLLGEIGWDRVDAIKMDIEGSEGRAIQGMRRLLARDVAPVILYESNGLSLLNYGLRPGDLIASLEGFGYRVYRIEGERFRPAAPTDLHPETWTDVVALKPPHAARVADRIGPPLSEEEWVRKCVYEGTVPEPVQRAYIARTLARVEPPFLEQEAIRTLLDALAQDPVETVRRSAAWWLARPGAEVAPERRAS
jgi:FkbM family methyltransferase